MLGRVEQVAMVVLLGLVPVVEMDEYVELVDCSEVWELADEVGDEYWIPVR